MPNALLALQTQAPQIDAVNALASGEQIKTARLGNVLRNFQLQQAQAAQAKQNQLSQLLGEIGPGLVAGDEAAVGQLATVDPAMALDIQGKVATGKKTRLEAEDKEFDMAKKRTDYVAQTLGSVLSAPPEQQQALYQQAIASAQDMGIDVKGAPPQFDPQMAQGMFRQAMTLKEQLDQSKDARDFKERQRLSSPEYLAEKAAAEAKAKEPYENPIEVFDPSSPSGTRLRRPADAVGQPGKPGSGLRITQGPNGEFEVVQGPGVGSGSGGGGLTRPTQNQVQKEILSGGDMLASVNAIRARAKPEYQTIGNRWSNLKTAFLDKAGRDVDPKDRQELEEFTAYRAEAGQLFSNILKQMSGTAVTEKEMKRNEAWLPNPGTGLFDGDSPTQLKSKIDRLEDFTKKALAKYQYINKNGLSIDKVDVDDMPKIMQKRGDEIAAKYEASGLKGPALKNAVRGTLMEEFGIGVQ